METFSPIHRMTNDTILTGHDGCVNTLCWDDTGQFLLSGSDDTTVKLWDVGYTPPLPESPSADVAFDQSLVSFEGHRSNVFAVAFLPYGLGVSRGCRVLSASNDCDCRVFDLETRSCLHVLRQFKRRVYSISVEPSSQHCFLASSADGTVRHYDLRDRLERGAEVDESGRAVGNGRNLALRFERYEAMSVDHNKANANYFVVAVNDGKSYLFDMRFLRSFDKNSCVRVYWNRQLRNPLSHFPAFACFEESGKEVLVSCMYDKMYLFDANLPSMTCFDATPLSHIERQKLFLVKELPNNSETRKDPSPTNNACYCCGLGSQDGPVLENELENDEDAHEVHSSSEATPSPNTDDENTFYVDRTQPKLYKQSYRGHINCMTLKKPGFYLDRYVMSGSDDGNVYVYSRRSGRLKVVLKGRGDIINITQGCPSSMTIATSGIDDFISLWRPELPLDLLKDTIDEQAGVVRTALHNDIR